jgi:putative nucleotidyltransferase with HDIG domain
VPRDEKNTSCLNSRAIIEYMRRRFPDRVSELFADLPAPYSTMVSPEEYLSDENNWMSSAVSVKMFENARSITGNSNAAFDIGFETMMNREFGYFQRLFLTVFASPSGMLRRLNQLNSKLNTTKIVELVYDAPGRAVVRWHWKGDIAKSKDICEYNKGIYAAIPTIWGIPPGKIEENPCHFEGGEYCEVILSWSLLSGSFRNFLSTLSTRKSNLLNALEEIERDKTLLRQKFSELSALNIDLLQKVDVLKSINKATRALVSITDTQKVLEQTMKPIVEVLGFDRALIMMVDKAEEFLEYRYAIGESAEAITKITHYRIPLTREQNLMIRVLRKKRPVLITDAQAAGLNPSNLILADFNPSNFIVCPLIAEEKAIGILGADRRVGKERLTTNDREFLSIFANNIATALQRAIMDEELKSSYVSSVRALVQAIEEKDTYTRGHSERVSTIAVEAARTLGMSEAEIEYVRFGSILHDVGKIGIPESIVKSPKSLTSAEFKIIQKHPLKGVEILQPISFIKNHMYLIRNHHERWDGKGYPDGLAGDDIPLGAQIVAVADAFDAMTSSRPYRRGMPPRQAAREIQKNIGTQFSRRVAEAFLEVFEKTIMLKNEGNSA